MKRVKELAVLKRYNQNTCAIIITLANCVTIESASKILGHKDLRIPQHYAKIVDRKISDDRQDLKEKLDVKIKVIAKRKKILSNNNTICFLTYHYNGWPKSLFLYSTCKLLKLFLFS